MCYVGCLYALKPRIACVFRPSLHQQPHLTAYPAYHNNWVHNNCCLLKCLQTYELCSQSQFTAYSSDESSQSRVPHRASSPFGLLGDNRARMLLIQCILLQPMMSITSWEPSLEVHLRLCVHTSPAAGCFEKALKSAAAIDAQWSHPVHPIERPAWGFAGC